MAETQITVVIADDYYAFRQGLKVLLSFEPDIEVVGEAINGLQTIELVKKHNPDAVVMDLSRGGLSGIDVIKQVLEHAPETTILIVSG
ncbi:MAG: response regulator transcription factor, partial [Opitutus sp.]